jgi:hypothetical protein
MKHTLPLIVIFVLITGCSPAATAAPDVHSYIFPHSSNSHIYAFSFTTD